MQKVYHPGLEDIEDLIESFEKAIDFGCDLN